MRFLLVVSCLCWSVNCSAVWFRGAMTNTSSGTVWMRLYRSAPSPAQAQSASQGPSVGRYVGNSSVVSGEVWRLQCGTDASFVTVLAQTEPVTIGSVDVDQVLVWTGSLPPSVTNTVHSLCITNRSPLPRAVLVQVGSGASWEVVSSQNLIVLASGQEWCASYVVEGPPDATSVCATLVDPASLSAPFVAVWGRVCGSQSITTNAPTGSVVTGTISSPPLSNRLASVYGTNVAGMLSSTGALTGQNLGAFLAGMTDLTGAGSGAGGSSSGVTGGGSWTNAGIVGGASNGVPWDGSNIVSAVGHLENSLTNRQADWSQTNSYAGLASGMDAAGQAAGSGVASTVSNGFSGFGAGLAAFRDAYPVEAVTPVETKLGLLRTSASTPAIIRNKVEFDPWKYPGVRRIAYLMCKFLIWFGVLVVIQAMMKRTAFLTREFGKQSEGSSSTWVITAPGGVGAATGTPAGLVKAGIWAVALGGLAVACTAGIGHWFSDWQQPIAEAIADGTILGEGPNAGTVGEVWQTALVWVHRVVPLVTWLTFAIEYAAWWLLTNGVFTMVSTGLKFARL